MTRKRLLIITLLLMLVGCVTANNAPQTTQLSDDERMAWWRDASFGLFIHWGAYSIPGGERNGKICGGGAEWIMDKLDYTVEDYEEVVAQFNPVKFDADEWVSIAKDAGMKYIVITSKHHDGFCLWDSKITDYDIMDAAPFKRDIIKELSEACKKQGLKFCFYHSIVDWHHPQAQAPLYPNYNAGQRDQSVVNPEFPQYYNNYLKPQVKELLTHYGDIGVVWFDGDWIADYTTEMGKEFYSLIREIQPNTIVNNRVDKGRMGMEGLDREGNFAGDFGTPEQEIPDTGISTDWESCMTMNGSWGYKPSDRRWKSSERLIHNLIDVVSKGGNLLLNVGPSGEGLFPPESIERLKAMGVWTRANGESIYGAKASPYAKPVWGRYTSKLGLLYAHVFEWPQGGRLVINPEAKVKKASLLASGKALNIETSELGSVIVLPHEAPDSIATVVKLEVASTGHEYYVAGTGSDMNPGTKAAPFLTLRKAQSAVRDTLPTATEGITVWIRGGTYYLEQPLVFGPDDSGTPAVPVAYRGVTHETVVLSGAKRLIPTWKTHSETVHVASIGTGLEFDILFANHAQQVLARYPNYDAETVVLNGTAKDAASRTRAAHWKNPSTGLVRGLHHGRWGGNSFKISGLKSNGDVQLEWVGDNNRGSRLHSEYRMVENIFEELDAPGEWFYDKMSGKLYFYPPPGMDLATATIEVASLEELIRVVGNSDEKIKHLTFSDITFTGTRRTLFTREYEPLLRSDWCVARAGTVFIENAEHVTVSNAIFDRIGGNGIFISGYNRHHLIHNNEFLENGATCVNIVGLPSAVRYPSFWDDHKFDIQDKTPGPLTEDYPKDITVSYNHMENMGRFEKQTCGVNLSMSESITVSHNTVHGSPRAGLNVCDGTWGGHLFEYNDVFNCVRETSDHGPWNSWGRDRFYTLFKYQHSGAYGTEKKPFASLDAWKTTIIRNNRIHYDEPTSYGIDLDDGSSNHDIYNNLLLNTQIKLREGFNRNVYNNIVINNKSEFHVWYDKCGDRFVNNIVVNGAAYNTRWIKSSRADALEATLDYNLFYNAGGDVTVGDDGWLSNGWDVHSVIANPQFVNPKAMDYRVKPGSPALKLGFVNFPMDQFGKPGAPQPDPIEFVEEALAQSDSEPLMGATVASVSTMSIQSVLGSPDRTGIYFESVPDTSYAADQGFKKHDAIRSVNGTRITTQQSFWKIYNALEPGATVSITLLRNQHEQPFTFVKPRS